MGYLTSPGVLATVAGVSAPRVFPLRLRNERLRELSREVARHESISQNDLIEQALEHELVERGAMLVADLQSAVNALAALTEGQHAALVDRSLVAFATGEGRPEPVRARRIRRERTLAPAVAPAGERDDDPLGVLAAFTSATSTR